MRLLGKFGQTVTLARAIDFGEYLDSYSGEHIIGAGREVVLLDSRGCPGDRVYVVNGETKPRRGRSQGREVYAQVRRRDLKRYPDDPARPDPKRALWSRP